MFKLPVAIQLVDEPSASKLQSLRYISAPKFLARIVAC